MKSLKKIVSAVAAVAAVATMGIALAGCGSSENAYITNAKFNSETENMKSVLVLEDEDSYVVTVYALNSSNSAETTAMFYMQGEYTIEGNLVTLTTGRGFCHAMNGANAVDMEVNAPTGGMAAAMIGASGILQLNEDGTFEAYEE